MLSWRKRIWLGLTRRYRNKRLAALLERWQEEDSMAIPVPPPIDLELPADTIISCPNCGVWIARLGAPLRMGGQINVEDFHVLQAGHQAGTPMECRVCGTGFIDPNTGALHTVEGWKPPLPKPEAFRG